MDKDAWKIASQRALYGQPVAIKSLLDEEGNPLDIAIKPRKYSQRGADEMGALALRKQAFIKGESRKKLLALGLSPDDLYPLEPPADASEEAKAAYQEKEREAKRKREEITLEVLGDADSEIFSDSDRLALILKYGVHAHNFDGEWAAPSDAWIDAVLDNPELTREIVKIVEDFNRPLAKR